MRMTGSGLRHGGSRWRRATLLLSAASLGWVSAVSGWAPSVALAQQARTAAAPAPAAACPLAVVHAQRWLGPGAERRAARRRAGPRAGRAAQRRRRARLQPLRRLWRRRCPYPRCTGPGGAGRCLRLRGQRADDRPLDGLPVTRHVGRPERRDDGRVAGTTRWCSDRFDIACDNGERVGGVRPDLQARRRPLRRLPRSTGPPPLGARLVHRRQRGPSPSSPGI